MGHALVGIGIMIASRIGRTVDFLATTVAVVAVWTGTPVGGIAERIFRKTVGMGPAEKPLIAYFDVRLDPMITWVVDEKELVRPFRAAAEEDETVSRIALTSPVPTSLARAFAVVASGGRVALDDSRRSWYDIRPLDHHSADRKELGLPPMTGGAAALLDDGLRARVVESLDLLAAYEARLGGDDAALAAWALGLPLIDRAVDRAKLIGERKPGSIEGFDKYLTRKDLERARAFVGPIQALRIAYEMKWPVEGGYPITSFFGMRPHPLRGDLRLHAGVDLGAPEGVPFVAVADGVVRHAGNSAASGLNLQIDHGHGLSTAYLHASVLSVNTGDQIKSGQVIGRVGSTGISTGPHLHYGVYVAGRPVDPLVFRPPEMTVSVDLRGPARPPPRRNPGRN